MRTKTIYCNEPPSINPTLKGLIGRRQKALSQENGPLFRFLRNCVNRERKTCRDIYYKAKIAHLKECKPSVWCKEVKKLSGTSSAYRHSDDFTMSLHHMEASSGKQNLANIINEAFIGPMNQFSPLPSDFELDMVDFPSSPLLVVSAPSVYRKLSTLNPTKAQGPDGIPAWLLRENAHILMFTVMDILNTLYREVVYRHLGKWQT